MKLVLTATWQPVPAFSGERIEIAGFTAAVEDHGPVTGWEFTVLQDHLRIVGTGIRRTRLDAKAAAEALIESAANSVFA